jgi:hypothetical protein
MEGGVTADLEESFAHARRTRMKGDEKVGRFPGQERAAREGGDPEIVRAFPGQSRVKTADRYLTRVDHNEALRSTRLPEGSR